jgi:mobilization protein NikA
MNDTDLHVRLYPEEKRIIRQRSQHHDLSMSEYVRRLVAAEERRELQSRIYPLANVRTIAER